MNQEASQGAELPHYRTYTSMSIEGEAAVGRIAIWEAWLEQTLVHFCSALIDGRAGVGTTLTEGMAASQIITLQQVVEELNTKHSTIRALIHSGKLPAIQIGGRGQWRIERAKLEEYIAGAYVRARADIAREDADEASDLTLG